MKIRVNLKKTHSTFRQKTWAYRILYILTLKILTQAFRFFIVIIIIKGHLPFKFNSNIRRDLDGGKRWWWSAKDNLLNVLSHFLSCVNITKAYLDACYSSYRAIFLSPHSIFVLLAHVGEKGYVGQSGGVSSCDRIALVWETIRKKSFSLGSLSLKQAINPEHVDTGRHTWCACSCMLQPSDLNLYTRKKT